MAITSMTSNLLSDYPNGEFPEGAFCPFYWNRADQRERLLRDQGVTDHAIVTYEHHHGLVLATGERNAYSDSDFYAIVWNPEKQEPERIEYGTTRFWTYPCTAGIDASDEVRAAYKAWEDAAAEEERQRRAAYEAKTPSKGKRVTVIGGRKVPVGTEATVFWFGEAREFGPVYRGGYKAERIEMSRYVRSRHLGDPREGMRVGLLLEDGQKVYMAATHVEVNEQS